MSLYYLIKVKIEAQMEVEFMISASPKVRTTVVKAHSSRVPAFDFLLLSEAT